MLILQWHPINNAHSFPLFYFFFIFSVDNIKDFPIFPHLPASTHSPLPFPLAITTLLSVSMSYAYMFFGSSFHLLSHSMPFPSDYCQSVLCVHASVSVLFISLFCLLDSTCKCDYVVFVFL